MKHINLESIKTYLLKRDNLVILILTGVLLLVIAWPVEEVAKSNNETDLWDRNGSNLENNILERNAKENSDGSLLEDFEEIFIDNGILQEEYIINRLEQRLEEILTSMQGVGRVKVMVTLASGGEKIVEKDIPLERSNIAENDSAGGSRSTNEMYSQETTVYRTNSQGDKEPYVIKENSAVVAGVSVVAEGGGDALVQKHISDIIQALFGIEAHKIKVVKMKPEE